MMVQKTADMISAVFFIVFFNLSTEGFSLSHIVFDF
ncbi:hypothetical protein SAMN04488689_12018 [Paenibacillus sp. cl6col]|nr:hypothetical protein SAMN04488689_12018 [Paenibacillus sp. cl6col]